MAASAAGRHVAGTALAENRKERNMTGNTNAGTAGEDSRNGRPGWIEDRPGKDTAEAREGIARLAGPLGTMAEEWEDDGSPFLATVRKSPLFYRVPETNRHRLYDDRFADGLTRAVGAEKAEEALRGTLWRLGRADRRLCKAWREVWFLKRFRVEDDGSLRSAFASADRNAFVVVGGGDAASLPAWLHNRAFPLTVVARFCEDGVVRFSARAFGSRRPGNATAAQEEKHMRLALALERIRQRLVGIARTESWDGVVAAAGEVTYRLASEESGLSVESIRNLLHRKDVHPMRRRPPSDDSGNETPSRSGGRRGSEPDGQLRQRRSFERTGSALESRRPGNGTESADCIRHVVRTRCRISIPEDRVNGIETCTQADSLRSPQDS